MFRFNFIDRVFFEGYLIHNNLAISSVFIKCCCIIKKIEKGNRLVTKDNFPENKKLTVIFRMEPGSLGPDGAQYINEFCEFAQVQLQACAEMYICWLIIPRLDKSLVEMEFQLSSKKLTSVKAGQYLAVFGENIEHFEEQLEDNLEAIINQYFGR